MLVRRI